MIAPSERDAIARRALAVAQEHYAGAATFIRHPDISLFAQTVGGGADVGHAELLSFLLFTPEFARALVAMGQEDASRWLQSDHDRDALWQEGPLPAAGG